MNGNGYLSLAEIDKGVRDVLHSKVADLSPTERLAFGRMVQRIAPRAIVPVDGSDETIIDPYADVVVERILHDYDAMTLSCALRNALSPFRVPCSNSTGGVPVAPSEMSSRTLDPDSPAPCR